MTEELNFGNPTNVQDEQIESIVEQTLEAVDKLKERKIKWTKKQWIQFLNRIDSDSPTPEECIYLRNEIKRKEL